jgi:hypothetical protein
VNIGSKKEHIRPIKNKSIPVRKFSKCHNKSGTISITPKASNEIANANFTAFTEKYKKEEGDPLTERIMMRKNSDNAGSSK